MNDQRADYRQGYVHSAMVPCPSCEGSGRVGGERCFVCFYEPIIGSIKRGCGGPGEVDANHSGMGYCIAEDRFVPVEELRRP